MTVPQLSGASAPNRTPRRWVRVSPRLALRAGLVLLALALVLAAVAGCGDAELPGATPLTAAPQPSRPAAPTPTTAAPTTTGTAPTTAPSTGHAEPTTGPGGTRSQSASPDGGPRAGGAPGTGSSGTGSSGTGPQARGGAGVTGGHGTPIWPAADAAGAKALQQQVDGGGEPWLLDPTEVAVSYAGVALKYRNPSVFTIRPGVLDVQDGAGPAKATLTLAQTVRRGDGGIWLVTEVRRR